MKNSSSIPVRFRFAQVDPGRDEYFASAARSHLDVLSGDPLAVSTLPLGSSSQAAAGLLHPSDGPGGTPGEMIRLRAIEGPDGCLVQHSADPVARTLTSTWSDGQVLATQWNAAGLPLSVRLGDAHRLEFAYDSAGRRARLSYGPSASGHSTYQWTPQNRLGDLILPFDRIHYERDHTGALSRLQSNEALISLHRGPAGLPLRVEMAAWGATVDFPLPSGSSSVHVAEKPSGGMTTLISPLGIHTIDPAGRVKTWFRWDGDCLDFLYCSDGRIRVNAGGKPWRRTGPA